MVQEFEVVLDHVGYVEEHLVEAETFHPAVPRVGAEEGVQALGDIAEGREVLAVDDDELGTETLGFGERRQLAHALFPGHVVTSGEDALLADAQWQCLEGRLLILDDLFRNETQRSSKYMAHLASS